MATEKPPKSSKWFSNKNLQLSFKRLRSESSTSRRLNCVPNSRVTSPASLTTPEIVTTARQEDELKQVFSYFDTDGDGKISALELRAYFGSVGEYMSHEDAESVIKELDVDGDGLLDFSDFLKLMKRGAANDEEEDLKKAFEMFELKKGDGCITPRGLQRMLNRLGNKKSLDECVAMIQVFDTDGDGVLDFHEFHQMMS
ncbi:probable calcium-binding protein CML41 [Ricinus communis]|uniref:Calmodulin, putative n=1 Tax=Ricinus communis TaxID=3988 RepID=B9T4V6_RICCO|nr:probable calcium-binding protein CML41 [Ricinus communis]EEF29107.1 Calmodulin, putative [Ricinus communis]|eukprot:XP_002533275.1 probable calcium-binding protein CML41 [Ricinus communis]